MHINYEKYVPQYQNKKQKPRHKDSKNTSISGRGNHTIYLGINAFIRLIVIVVTDFVIKLCVNIKMHACPSFGTYD